MNWLSNVFERKTPKEKQKSIPLHNRELVDFGEIIGYHICMDNPAAKNPTTRGIIHYGKEGAHIIPANPNSNVIQLSKLLLSSMRALWGIITPNLRKVSVELEENAVALHFYYSETPTEDEIELSEVAASEVIADFPESLLIECQRHVITPPRKIEHIGSLVYSRSEKSK